MAGRLGYEIWREFFTHHEAHVTLDTVDAEPYRVIPDPFNEGFGALDHERQAVASQ